jgi:hypothetical protein
MDLKKKLRSINSVEGKVLSAGRYNRPGTAAGILPMLQAERDLTNLEK